jgi:N,N'-diacetyllegionaminate synthase
MKFKRTIYINNKIVSDDSPVFIIAEAGVNHGGDMNIAKKLIDVASDAGADAVKFQAFKTEHLILQNVKKAPYQQKTTAKDESQYNMLKKLEVTKEQNLELIEYCRQKDIIFLTTPFDEYSLDELDSVELPAYKVASTDTTNLPFLRKMAMKDKPIILSTGMSYLSEVRMALEEIYKYNQDVILLQCTANYPIKDDEANLNVINTYKDNFDILIGYSDHSVGIGASPYAVPMGAKVVEKHFTLSKDDDGPDHAASLTPEELKEYVKTIRKVEKYLGTSIKSLHLMS